VVIEKLVKRIPVEEFLGRYYLSLPYAEEGNEATLNPYLDGIELETFLGKPGCEVSVIDEDGSPTEERFGPPSTLGDLTASGRAVIIHHAERHRRKLAKLARSFRKDFHGPVNLHLAFIPASAGLGWHYDAEEVFLYQTRGKTELSLPKSGLNPFILKDSRDVSPENAPKEPDSIETWNLEAGDWVYIPAGYRHKETARADSIVLFAGVQAPSSMKVYDYLKECLLKSMFWRKRLPIFGKEQAPNPGEVLPLGYRKVDFRQTHVSLPGRTGIADRRLCRCRSFGA